MAGKIIEARDLQKIYRLERGGDVHALRGVSLSIEPGDMTCIIGSSGSGKSTLLHILGLMDRPTSGILTFQGRPLAGLSDREMTRIRCSEVGFVFQTFNLIPCLTAQENVALPARFATAGTAAANVRKRSYELLESVGLIERANHRPREMSGGERQRVAIARALMNGPGLLLADEPTGNLDSATGLQIVDLLVRLNAAGQTMVIVTHNPEVASACRIIYRMKDGRLERVENNQKSVG